MRNHLTTLRVLVIGAALALAGCGQADRNPAESRANETAAETAAATESAAASDTATAAESATAAAKKRAEAATTVATANASGETTVAASADEPIQPIAFTLSPKQYNACMDFASFVNAKWNNSHTIPSDRSSWGAFGMLRQESLENQRHILEHAAKLARKGKASDLQRKLGRLYAAGMDTETINQLGYTPIKPMLADIQSLQSSNDIARYIRHAFDAGNHVVFYFYSSADFEDASTQIGYTHQGGLGLPTRAYYLKDKYKDIRQDYLDYITDSFKLVDIPADKAKKMAQAVLAFETELAKASLTPIQLRDLDNQYNFVTVAEANKVTPHFSWNKFFQTLGVEIEEGFSLSQPEFMARFDKLLAKAPVSQWQAYLTFHLIDDAAPALSKPFQKNRYQFYGKTLRGQPEPKPRWKNVVMAVNHAMGMALGELYVARYFPPRAKARAEELVANMIDAMEKHIKNLKWMSDATKEKALKKLSLILPKIGYPDEGQWREWDGLEIQPGHYFANLRAAQRYNYHYNLSKIGEKTNRREWHMTPQTVNAYYSPSTNTINFPAAILQPPFFYPEGDLAVNYGGIGFVIGHELTHGFDDQGSHFDGYGNRDDWWTEEDRAKFKALTQQLVKQYNQYTPIKGKPELHVKGKLTLGENIADLGGLNIAYTALQMALEEKPGKPEPINGHTPAQRFFMSSARVWEGETRKKSAMVQLNTDPHSPNKIRAMASARNMVEFAKAFNCEPSDRMVLPEDKRVQIW